MSAAEVRTSYATVIVTRNRPEALALSLPLHIMQSRLPERILVVDSSDDPTANRATVARVARTTPVPVDHQISLPGMTVQRNMGLAEIDTDVVFFPDDDSLVFPGALEHMMLFYDRDTAFQIGGVCAAEAQQPPSGVLQEFGSAYHKRRSDRLRALIAPIRRRVEDRFAPDPMRVTGQRLQARLPPLEPWLAQEGGVRVEWMTGFRMSFRTALIRSVGFNERLGRYALYEDIDAGFGVMARGYSLVAALEARIYHHKAPERRANGREIGAINILNRAYIVRRSAVYDREIGHLVRRYAWFRRIQFQMGQKDSYGRERYQGALRATGLIDTLLAASDEGLDETYLALREECLRMTD